MADYKVKVLGVQGINNRVYKGNEVVTTEHFPEGVAEKLANDGKLELVVKAAKKEVKEETEKEVVKAAKKEVKE